ncbi:hypothetical protein [Pseudomonas viridiflava]|uniref:hypothetical protein n=1 Tax=Pseudomonas viridiflava TaxID=33069 RepID=UPI000F01459D|nr:hypothetical protein [Pseudomonas viridiflava]
MPLKFKLALSFVLAAALLSGCDANKGSAFAGRWVSTTQDSTAKQGQTVLVITPDNAMYHIDVTKVAHNVIQKGDTQEYKSKLEGKAESDNVLSLVGGLVTMRLQDGKILYEDKEFVKSK